MIGLASNSQELEDDEVTLSLPTGKLCKITRNIVKSRTSEKKVKDNWQVKSRWWEKNQSNEKHKNHNASRRGCRSMGGSASSAVPLQFKVIDRFELLERRQRRCVTAVPHDFWHELWYRRR